MTTTLRPRHEPCTILQNHGISCLLWFEDALAAHGVPTAVFDLYLLVNSLAGAEDALVAKGWTPAPQLSRGRHILSGSQCIPHRRLVPPKLMTARDAMEEGSTAPPSRGPPESPRVVLLPAANWGVSNLDTRLPSGGGFVPPLALLIDGLVGVLMDLPVAPTSETLQGRLGTQLAYLYRYCAGLKNQNFAESLKLEHRQFHYDALSKPGLGTIPFISEQRQNRDEIRKGERQPQRNSWYLAPELSQGKNKNHAGWQWMASRVPLSKFMRQRREDGPRTRQGCELKVFPQSPSSKTGGEGRWK
ncbi:uncharacterized protein B0H64DRAFT_469176 [Chaetomium fimeti]|uniref:Uncharacterized protein n=1 Tax=Chaetomium fimeti TaxID=1854472 RepID=A0AAE0LNT3_9PEZI|nr:hypothetical protein B0H64DRAFT_469176 [Chaetomium fimeti]